MSRIFPAGGGKKVSWMDKVEENAEKEDLIGTAALDLKTLRKLAGFGDKSEGDDFEEEDVNPEDAEEAEAGDKPAFLEENKEISDEEGEDVEEDGEEEIEESEKDEETNPSLDQAVEAVEKAKEALDEITVALEDAGASDDVAEIPVSMEGDIVTPSDDATVEVEISSDVDSAVDEDMGDGIGTQDNQVDNVNSGVANGVLAGSSSRFHKIAMLSPANKKKLKDYWIGSLGYDPDFVGMMLKDYNPKSGSKKD